MLDFATLSQGDLDADRTRDLKDAWSQTDLDYLASSFGHETLLQRHSALRIEEPD
ncbi:MAG: hypothetical protein U0904_10215 [Candidatus Nanopelagicales bacterium]|nr:hypothetical protein [Candidatus Nanopelagicales bacterium]